MDFGKHEMNVFSNSQIKHTLLHPSVTQDLSQSTYYDNQQNHFLGRVTGNRELTLFAYLYLFIIPVNTQYFPNRAILHTRILLLIFVLPIT